MPDSVFDKLKTRFPSAVLGQDEFRSEQTIEVASDKLYEVAKFLRDDSDLQYNMLMDVYGLDRRDLGLKPRFASIYELYSMPNNKHVRLSVAVPEM